MEFTNMITINRRPAEVFGFLARFENVPLWNYAVSGTRQVSGGRVGVGTRYRQTRTFAFPRSETFEVTGFEPDRRIAIDGALGPFRGEVSYLLRPAGPGTALVNTVNLQPRGLLRFVAPLATSLIKAAVAANLSTLKQILESTAWPTTQELKCWTH
jgi:hypothetical protein